MLGSQQVISPSSYRWHGHVVNPRDERHPDNSRRTACRTYIAAVGTHRCASGTTAPATTSGSNRNAFPKHARLDGPKTFANWTRQLRLCLADDIRSYVLDGITPTIGRLRNAPPATSWHARSLQTQSTRPKSRQSSTRSLRPTSQRPRFTRR
ncbi:BZ3501_MvSof-1269-A2-R1_Chr2-2g04388 [Microbotryum saponariae]|nr:BZ3501_MvSof-1269-A2-R1_Chr2-2g04388 [Microbotryum saponariae]